jgi:hypothetical protein
MKMADKLARQASTKPPLGPELALGIPRHLTRDGIKTELSINITVPVNIYQDRDMVSFLKANHVRKGQMTCSK